MALATPRNFAIQQVFEILGRKPIDKSILFYLTNTKTSGLENTVEMVYPTGQMWACRTSDGMLK